MNEIQQALARWFKHAAFRPGQEEAIRESLAGHDVLLVMPTGMGKSLCYQLTALLLPHTTLVISPLIALMKDQVDAMDRLGIPATFLNSSVDPEEMAMRLARMRTGQYKLVYIAPERFRNARFLDVLRQMPVSLLTVDEAHCISQWGHDFRPDYLNLKNMLPLFPEARIMAVTATATPDVREDITVQLGLGVAPRAEPVVHVHGFARPNLNLAVIRTSTHEVKMSRVGKLIEQHGSGIIYAATRKQAERIHVRIKKTCKVPALLYHGALSDEERTRVQDAFVAMPQAVIVATNAFGMGVDRKDLRFIAHWDMPGSVEAYYQEVGRAGRDGLPAWCELLFNYADVRTQRFFIDSSNPSMADVRAVLAAVEKRCEKAPQAILSGDEWSAAAGLDNPVLTRTILGILERAGFLHREPVAGQRSPAISVVAGRDPNVLDEVMEARKVKLERDNRRLDAMLKYVDHRNCRHQYILRYFGEAAGSGICGGCDCCGQRTSVEAHILSEAQWIVLQKVLSCVGRMKGQYGARRVVQVLRGEEDPILEAKGLTRLSTFGLLSDHAGPHLMAIIDALIRDGSIAVTPDAYRMLSLTPRGLRVVNRQEPDYRFAWPAVPAATRKRRVRSR